MKKTIIIGVTVLLALSLSACAFQKTAITAEDFTRIATSLGYSVDDATEQMEGNTETSLLAYDEAQDFQIEFHVVSTRSQASTAYSENKAKFDGIGAGSNLTMSGMNWASYAKTAGGKYSYVAYIETTMVYVSAPEEYKQDIKDFISELGY